MKKLANRIRKNKKGFTLVEMVVVLVIIAILATLGIGALTQYIDKANQRTAIANCRAYTLAVQTTLSEEYAKGDTTLTAANFAITGGTSTDETAKATLKLSGVSSADVITVAIGADNNSVATVTYKDKNGKTAVYSAANGTITIS